MANDGDTRRDEVTPPTTTRWSEEPVPESDDLAPPFVPGRPAPKAESEQKAEAEAEPFPFEETGPEDEPFPFEETGPEDDEFPADRFDLEGAAEQPATPPAEPLETDATEAAAQAEWSPADLYGEGTEAVEESAVEPEPWAPTEETVEPGDPWAADEGGDAWDEPEEAEPWAGAGGADAWTETEEAADYWAETREADRGVEPEPSRAAGRPVPSPAFGQADATQLAALLERLARLIREEGPEALRSEMNSADRFTGALAGMLAGYLSGP